MKADWIVLGGAAIFGLVLLFDRPNSSNFVGETTSVHQFPVVTENERAAMNSVVHRNFGGYACTSDCSGHIAGYEWAEQNAINDAGDCHGNSESFIEGCQSYVADHRGEDDNDDDLDNEDS